MLAGSDRRAAVDGEVGSQVGSGRPAVRASENAERPVEIHPRFRPISGASASLPGCLLRSRWLGPPDGRFERETDIGGAPTQLLLLARLGRPGQISFQPLSGHRHRSIGLCLTHAVRCSVTEKARCT
jgi:hypothetical protein